MLAPRLLPLSATKTCYVMAMLFVSVAETESGEPNVLVALQVRLALWAAGDRFAVIFAFVESFELISALFPPFAIHHRTRSTNSLVSLSRSGALADGLFVGLFVG